MEESRRRELQASCFGRRHIGANKRYYPMSGGLYTQWQYVVNTPATSRATRVTTAR